MPYIDKKSRETLSPITEQVKTWPTLNPGELNYLFTIICHQYLQAHNLSYQRLNDCIGALEGAKLELYRRVASPYEDKKIEDNGDV